MRTTKSDTHNLSEPHAHVMMRRAHAVTRYLLGAALVLTIALFIFYRPLAYLAAIAVPVLYTVLLLASNLEQQSRESVLRHSGQTEISKEEVDMDVDNAGIWMYLKIFAALTLGAFIVAASLFDWAMVGIVFAATFLLALLYNLPFIALIVSETQRDELEDVQPLSQRNTSASKVR